MFTWPLTYESLKLSDSETVESYDNLKVGSMQISYIITPKELLKIVLWNLRHFSQGGGRNFFNALKKYIF